MKLHGLDNRDLLATFWVAVATAVFGVVRAGVDVPGLHRERLLAATVLVLGAFACGAGARDDAVTRRGVTTPFVAVLRAFGVVLLAIGIAAVAIGTPAATALLLSGTLAMWFASTVRHALVPPTPRSAEPGANAPAPRTREMSS